MHDKLETSIFKKERSSKNLINPIIGTFGTVSIKFMFLDHLPNPRSLVKVDSAKLFFCISITLFYFRFVSFYSLN
jgi:hypothetical protein